MRHNNGNQPNSFDTTSLESQDLPHWHRRSFREFSCSNNYLHPTLSSRTEGIFWKFFSPRASEHNPRKQEQGELGSELCGFLILRIGFGHGFLNKMARILVQKLA